MKCLRCGPLIKAIDAYLAKAENDLYEQLTMEGYLKAKESLNTVDEIEEVVTKLLEDNADDLLTASAVTVDDVNGVLIGASNAVGGVGDIISGGSDTADGASNDVLNILNAIDKSLTDLEDKLRGWGTAEDPSLLQQQLLQQIDDVTARLISLKEQAPQLADKIDAAVDKLAQLRDDIANFGDSAVKDALLDKLAEVRQTVRAAALETNDKVNDFIHDKNDKALAALASIQELLKSGEVDFTIGQDLAYQPYQALSVLFEALMGQRPDRDTYVTACPILNSESI